MNTSFGPKPFKTEKEREIHNQLQKVESNLQPKRIEDEVTEEGKEQEERIEIMLDNIQRQLEFYFGDPNLTKDKNLREIMMRDPRRKGYVDLDVFLTFNRVRSFFFDCNISDEKLRHKYLGKAVKRSKLLKLDSSKRRVRRRVQFDFRLFTNPKFRLGVNERTIFIENLPSFVDQEILAKAFQDYGKILYISIPKDKEKVNKGFAFIEYSVGPDLYKIG